MFLNKYIPILNNLGYSEVYASGRDVGIRHKTDKDLRGYITIPPKYKNDIEQIKLIVKKFETEKKEWAAVKRINAEKQRIIDGQRATCNYSVTPSVRGRRSSCHSIVLMALVLGGRY